MLIKIKGPLVVAYHMISSLLSSATTISWLRLCYWFPLFCLFIYIATFEMSIIAGIVVTNDGNAILCELGLEHLAAKAYSLSLSTLSAFLNSKKKG